MGQDTEKDSPNGRRGRTRRIPGLAATVGVTAALAAGATPATANAMPFSGNPLMGPPAPQQTTETPSNSAKQAPTSSQQQIPAAPQPVATAPTDSVGIELAKDLPIVAAIGMIGALVAYGIRKRAGLGGGVQPAGGGGKGGVGDYGKARIISDGLQDVRFKDVQGIDMAKAQLEEVVGYLRNPQRALTLGAKVPSGVLLSGPPGGGKTLLARAIAGEAGVPFFSSDGSAFVDMYVGVGASRVRSLFSTATEELNKRAAEKEDHIRKKHQITRVGQPKPMAMSREEIDAREEAIQTEIAHMEKTNIGIVFIDEVDSIGRARSANGAHSSPEHEHALNQLLAEMNGIPDSQRRGKLVVIGATNRPDMLDPALTRPGRFDRHVVVERPDINGRLKILELYVKNKPLADDVDLPSIARDAYGMTGADIANLVNEAAWHATRRDADQIARDDFSNAINDVLVGLGTTREQSDQERRLTAYHEAAHAMMAYVTHDHDPTYITVVPRGRAGGFMVNMPEKEPTFVSREQLRAKMLTALGGYVAEELKNGQVSTGPSSDLQQVTDVATSMARDYGMMEGLETRAFPAYLKNGSSNPSRQADIDAAISREVERAKAEVAEILTKNIDILDDFALNLMKVESMQGGEVKKFLEERGLEQMPAAQPATGRGVTERFEIQVVPDGKGSVKLSARALRSRAEKILPGKIIKGLQRKSSPAPDNQLAS